tara:strand:- start:1478 stop:1906 length:429 start_codon:yes stop_codon:yes gene_type:complete
MKTLKDIMNESGMNPAHNHSKHDSDHDMVDVSDDNVVRRLNSFLGCIADMDHMLPEQTIEVVRRRLANIGLSFPTAEIVEDNGNISLPLTQFGGRFGKDIDTPHNEFIKDDGISHRVEGGRSINFVYEKKENGKFKVTAEIK